MLKHLKALIVASTIGLGLAAAPAIDAHDSGGSDGSMMGPGMMGQMSSMMENCNQMVQAMKDNERGDQRPNEQWQKRSPQQDQPQSEDDAG